MKLSDLPTNQYTTKPVILSILLCLGLLELVGNDNPFLLPFKHTKRFHYILSDILLGIGQPTRLSKTLRDS